MARCFEQDGVFKIMKKWNSQHLTIFIGWPILTQWISFQSNIQPYWNLNIPAKLGQCHGWWYPGCLRDQAISSHYHDIGCLSNGCQGIHPELQQPAMFQCPLQWRHNERDGVSRCYSTVYSRCRSKKTSMLRVTGLCAGNSPHKRPVTWKIFPFDDVIMIWHDVKCIIYFLCFLTEKFNNSRI